MQDDFLEGLRSWMELCLGVTLVDTKHILLGKYLLKLIDKM